jgi:hypothetical protein
MGFTCARIAWADVCLCSSLREEIYPGGCGGSAEGLWSNAPRWDGAAGVGGRGVGLVTLPAPAAVAAPEVGGQLFSSGGGLEVEVLEAGAGLTSELWLFEPGPPRMLASNRDVGRSSATASSSATGRPRQVPPKPSTPRRRRPGCFWGSPTPAASRARRAGTGTTAGPVLPARERCAVGRAGHRRCVSRLQRGELLQDRRNRLDGLPMSMHQPVTYEELIRSCS